MSSFAPGLSDRLAGCLLGGALGDALAGPFENGPIGQTFREPEDLWLSDDTQLTLATCEALIESDGAVDPASIAASFLRWHRDRRLRGVGASTLKTLRELEVGGHWALVGASGERAAGDGAAMRAAPLAFVLNPDDPARGGADRRTLRDVCRITHHNEEAGAAALMVLRAVRHAATGGLLAELPDRLANLPPDCATRDRLRAVQNERPTLPDYVARYGASGWAVDAVPLAILAASRDRGFLETIAEIVACGGDADTIASMTGQILGAARGPAGLPADRLERLENAQQIETIAARLAATIAAARHRPRPQGAPSPDR